jgi:outer membrane immunogenic protein
MADSQDSAHTETTSVGCLEFNYRYIGANAGSSGSVGPIIVQGATRSNGDTVQYAVLVSSNAAIMLKDVLTARARLPYAFAGFAVGRADVSRITSVTGMKSTTTPAVFDAFGNVIVPPQTTTAALLLPRSPQSTSESTIVTDFHWASALTSAYYKTCSFGPSGNTRSFPTSTTFAST